MTPSERSLAASLAAHTSWGRTEDRRARTAPARAALEARFLEEANGDPKRAQNLRTAYFKRLALKSAQSRRRAAGLLAEAEIAEAELKSAGGDAA